jgi:hypothetical protein
VDSVEGLNRIIIRAADRALETLAAGGGQGAAMLMARGAGLPSGEAVPQTLQYDANGDLTDGFRFDDGPGFGSGFLL